MEATLNKILPELELKENETLVLFLNDKNGWMEDNPIADLVVVENYDYDIIKKEENKIPGAYHTGGSWKRAIDSSSLKYRLILDGRKSDFVGIVDKYHKYETYNVISGTY